MSGAQIFFALLSLAAIGFAITVIEQARGIIRGEREAEALRREAQAQARSTLS